MRGTTRAEDAQGTPTQSHISPSILEYEDKRKSRRFIRPENATQYVARAGCRQKMIVLAVRDGAQNLVVKLLENATPERVRCPLGHPLV